MNETTQTQESVKVVVTQQSLVEIIGLKNRIKQEQDKLEELEKGVKDLLVAGAKVEGGTHLCELKMITTGRPSWKEEAIALANKLKGAGKGEEWAAAIQEKARENAVPVATLKIR